MPANAERKKRLLREAWRKGYFAGVVPANAMSVSQLLSAPPRAKIVGCCLVRGKLRMEVGYLVELSLTKDND